MEAMKRPAPIRDFSICGMSGGIVSISAPPLHFQQYLVLGADRAMLIDTGFGLLSLKKIVEGLTSLPVVLVNTHGHPDHVGGNYEFGCPYLHPLDDELYSHASTREERLAEAHGWKFWEGEIGLQPTPLAPIPITDGQEFELGGRKLKVVHTPGHTQGSVCLFDISSGILFSGDTVQRTPTALMEYCATKVSVYMTSLEKLAALPVTGICPGHYDHSISPDFIRMKLECCKLILSGARPQPIETRTGRGLEMRYEEAVIHYLPENAE